MKTTTFFTFIFLASLSFSQVKLNSTVAKVTVFASGAQVKRTATVKLEKGENELILVNLEQSINQQTIQLFGPEDVVVVSTDYVFEKTDEAYLSSEIRALKKQLRELDKDISLKNSSITNYRSEKDLILHNKEVKSQQEGLIIDDLVDLANFYRSNLNEIDSLIYETQVEVAELNKDRADIADQLQKKGFVDRMGVLRVKLLANAPKTIKLNLDYIVANAGWTPFYEMKANSITEPIKVTAKATVYQNTGVNWDNVMLSLSTSEPMNYGVKPEVHPWVLYFANSYGNGTYKKSSFYGWNSAPAAMSNSSYEMAADEMISSADFVTTTQNITNREFAIDLPYSIKGNGKVVVDIDKYEMKADYHYYTAPKYDKNVYLIANVDEWEELNLLPGMANIFLNGTYVGNTFIDPSKTADTLNLLMGKDQDIVAERKKVKDYCKKSILGGSNKTELGLEIIVKNKKNIDIHLIVEDQVPISKTEEIEVKLLDKSKAEHNEATGKLTWDYTLKAGEAQKHFIRYEVKYPKDKTIENL